MSAWDWVVSIAGAALVVAVVVDVVLSVLHQDIEGPIAKVVQRGTWAIFRGAARRTSALRRGLLAAGGPAMMVSTLAAWMVLFVLGFALLYWPQIETGFSADPDLVADPRGFIDALYFSGVTGTVLGYGDLTPDDGWLRVMAWSESGLGFALLTAIVTYLLSALGALGERNALALRLHHELERGEDGGALLADWLDYEDVRSAARRIDELAEALAVVQERLHRFPLVSFHYRSRYPAQDPELAFQRLTEVAVAAGLLSRIDAFRGLAPAARRLRRALGDAAELLAGQHISSDAARRIGSPQPDERDAGLVEGIAEGLHGRLGVDPRGERPDEVIELAFQMRVFLDGFAERTLWPAYAD
jgi:hypothetical protein